MIGRRAQENIIAVALLIVLIGVVVMSLGYGPRARMVPIPVAVFGIVLTLVQLVWQNLRDEAELHIDLLEVLTNRRDNAAIAGQEPAPTKASSRSEERWRREIVGCAMVLLFLGLTYLVGPVPAIFVFTLGYFTLSGQYRPLRAFVYTVLFSGAVYLMFVVALDIQLYHGLLEPLVERFR